VSAWLASKSVSGSSRAVLLTLAAIGALQLTNFVPRWSVSNLRRGPIASDGLQALCLLCHRPLPPRPAASPAAGGLNAPVSRSQLAVAIVVTCVALVFVAKHEFAIFYVCIGLEMQDLLNRAAPRAKPSRVDR
jgi:hypothetical protein